MQLAALHADVPRRAADIPLVFFQIVKQKAAFEVVSRLVEATCIFLAAACGSSQPSVTYPTYQFSCCPAEDVNQVWHPGATVELHWIVQQGTPAADPTPPPITLIATMTTRTF